MSASFQQKLERINNLMKCLNDYHMEFTRQLMNMNNKLQIEKDNLMDSFLYNAQTVMRQLNDLKENQDALVEKQQSVLKSKSVKSQLQESLLQSKHDAYFFDPTPKYDQRLDKSMNQLLQNGTIITQTSGGMRPKTFHQFNRTARQEQLTLYSPFHRSKSKSISDHLREPTTPTLKQMHDALCGVKTQLLINRVQPVDYSLKFNKLHRSILNNLQDADLLMTHLKIERQIKDPRSLLLRNFTQLIDQLYQYFRNKTYCKYPRPAQIYFSGDNLAYDCGYIIFVVILALTLNGFEPTWQEGSFVPVFTKDGQIFGPYQFTSQ